MLPTTALAASTLPLQDIHLPNAVGIWPLAAGWWIAILLTFIVIACGITIRQRYRKKWGYRNAALQLLKTQQLRCQQTNETKELHSLGITHEMLSILKRAAVTAYPSIDVGSLSGHAWVSFLNQQTPTRCFSENAEKYIIESQYKADTTIDHSIIDIENTYKSCHLWIKTHYSTPKIEMKKGDTQHV